MSDANKDDAFKAMDVSRRALASQDFAKASKFCEKAANMYSCQEVSARTMLGSSGGPCAVRIP